MFLGNSAAGLKEVMLHSAEAAKRFMVLAQEPKDALKILTPKIEMALTNWQGNLPVIKFTAEGLQIDVRGAQYKKEKDILALVNLAEALLEN